MIIFFIIILYYLCCINLKYKKMAITTEFTRTGNGAPNFILTVGEMYLDKVNNHLWVGGISGNVNISQQGASDSFIPVTYANLVAAVSASALEKGAFYRITDYQCTTVQADTVSADNQFDIIVFADSENTLNENAMACLHDGDTYFANANLGAWRLKYTTENDTAKFAWADEANGKGVIYYMQDEWGNECHYDFKNIKFARTAGGVVPQTDNYYTFSWVDENGDVLDLSLMGNSLTDDLDQYKGVYGNKIGICRGYKLGSPSLFALSKNVFISRFDFEGGIFYGCYSNTFGSNCHSNTFGNVCNSNTFGNGCYSNTFGSNCPSNTFGSGCHSNTFGNDCYSNTFGDYFYYNTFGSNCPSNTFGNGCYSNTFGNDCYSNTFGDECLLLRITNNAASKKYIHVDNGVKGGSGNNWLELYHADILNKNHQITFKRSVSGKFLMLWANDTGAMTGRIANSAAGASTVWNEI